MCSVCAVYVQCMCSVCAAYVQNRCSVTCAANVQTMCSVCAANVTYPPVPWAGISRVFHEYFKYSQTVPAKYS